jgi:tetratricopeptide (TPR) repeat protein
VPDFNPALYPTMMAPPLAASLEVHFRAANQLHVAGDFNGAIAELRAALQLMPDCAEAHYNLANVVRDAGEPLLALQGYEAAVDYAKKIKRVYPDALINWGDLLSRLGRHDQAIEKMQAALKIQPDRLQPKVGIGLALEGKGKLAAALKYFQETAVKAYNDAPLMTHIAVVLHQLGRFDESLAAYDKALAINPGYPEAHFERGKTLLLLGQLEEGFAEYLWRWQTANFQNQRRRSPAPEWSGQELAGKTLLVQGEQGFGDTIQFARYLPLLAARGAKVVALVQEPLRRLFTTLPGIDSVLNLDTPMPPHDYQTTVMSLPHLCGTTAATIPAEVPYLAADSKLVKTWAKKLADLPGKKAGIVWAGRPEYTMDKLRTIPVKALLPLARVDGISLVSLQQGAPAADKTLSAFDPGELADFAETAALIACLDLVITVDTAVAHLAGALGKPVWLLVPALAEWRWGLSGEDSPWYPTMRIFRQQKVGNWADLARRVAKALQDV